MIAVAFASCTTSAQNNEQLETSKTLLEVVNHKSEIKKMKVEIWSDVMCPYCYVGKTQFEKALSQFADKNNVEVEWKSFQLMPDLKTQPNKNLNQLTAEVMGMSLEQATAKSSQVVQMAKAAGLNYQFDKSVAANTFKAHQFIHFAHKSGKQNEAEEILFRSYFIDGKNVDDLPTLIELGKEIGLDTNELKTAIENETYADNVRADISEAKEIGVRGVPFFLFNRKYAVSGGQDENAFLETLNKSFAEWSKENPQTKFETIEGKVCTPDSGCN